MVSYAASLEKWGKFRQLVDKREVVGFISLVKTSNLKYYAF